MSHEFIIARSVRIGSRQRGFSLIEIMIAMVLGLLLIEGVFVLFSVTGRANTTQAALSRLQENGRIALQAIGDDLRQTGFLPCGSRIQPNVYAGNVATHIAGTPVSANPPPDAAPNAPFALDRGIFLGGSVCSSTACVPAPAPPPGIPRSGRAPGDKVPGTDILTVRYLQGSGWSANGNGSTIFCDKNNLSAIAVRRQPGDAVLDGLRAGHLALLAGCAAGEIFSATLDGDTVHPVTDKFGTPACMNTDAQVRLFDVDTQLQTSTYYVQNVADDTHAGRTIAVLMRRVNGVSDELVQGIERLDFRYSLLDALGSAHWLTAAEVDRGAQGDGSALRCGASDASRSCWWSDVNAVEVSMLVNTVDDLPADANSSAWSYRYSLDDDSAHLPAVAMPVTGLPTGHMLRREFKSVIALRNFAS